jgi:alkylhydroperoxidase/carboxymuconolactone decarboxylase family protein YurZ|tara:strand:- start:2491 stop:2700 length:210 start_codon:yes stop_codon:yes gene_type:complete
MGRVKDWLMCMESLAEEAIEQDLEEEEAVVYMMDNLHMAGLPALTATLRGIYKDKKDKWEDYPYTSSGV